MGANLNSQEDQLPGEFKQAFSGVGSFVFIYKWLFYVVFNEGNVCFVRYLTLYLYIYSSRQ